jgi:hypothetical protein
VFEQGTELHALLKLLSNLDTATAVEGISEGTSVEAAQRHPDNKAWHNSGLYLN